MNNVVKNRLYYSSSHRVVVALESRVDVKTHNEIPTLSYSTEMIDNSIAVKQCDDHAGKDCPRD